MSGPAVLEGVWLGTPGGRRARLPDGWTFDDVLHAADEITTVYVLGDVDDAHLVSPAEGPHTVPVEVTGEGERGPWRFNIARGLRVVLLERDEQQQSGPWSGLSARELLEVFAAFERLAGVPWSDGIGHTAEALILSTHPRSRGGVLLGNSPVTPAPAEDGGLELPWNWAWSLTAAERSCRWVHNYDANAQYLGAWITVDPLGSGVPVHHVAPHFDARRAGLWRLEGVDKLSTPQTPLLPPPWTENREWYTTQTVTRLLEVCEGYDAPEPLEAWIWPTGSRFLRAAGERLRDARAASRAEHKRARIALLGGETRSIAEFESPQAIETDLRRAVSAAAIADAVKLLYAVQTGRFNMAARDARSGWRRPDWGHAIRAQARVNLHRKLAKMTAAPFAIATDGLLFAADVDDPLEFAQRIGLPIGDGLGQFSIEGSAPMSSVRPVLEDEGRGRSVLPLFAAVADG